MGAIEWPPHLPRTPSPERDSGSDFKVSLARAFRDLEKQLDLIGVENFEYVFDAPSRQKDGRPYANASPDDPGFVLRWTKSGETYAVACDKFRSLRDNVRSVGLYVREKRKMGNRPVVTGRDEFDNLRLPAGDGSMTTDQPHEILGVSPDAPDDEVKAAYRRRVKTCHPDLGGSEETFSRVQRAYEEMING